MVLRAIPGGRAAIYNDFLKGRATNRDRSQLAASVPTISEHLLGQSSGVYRVRVDAELKDGYSDAAEAVIIAPQGGVVPNTGPWHGPAGLRFADAMIMGRCNRNPMPWHQ